MQVFCLCVYGPAKESEDRLGLVSEKVVFDAGRYSFLALQRGRPRPTRGRLRPLLYVFSVSTDTD